MVELIADYHVFQQAGASVRPARQGSVGVCAESETVGVHDGRALLLLLSNEWYVC
jgi:hypothetical protein